MNQVPFYPFQEPHFPNVMDPNKNDSYQYQINELKQKIRMLEQRIQTLENANKGSVKPLYETSMYMM